MPKDRLPSADPDDIPVTYVPGRNIIFLAHALSWAEVLGAADIFSASMRWTTAAIPTVDRSFSLAFERMANLGTRAGATGRPFRFHAPLVHLSKRRSFSREGSWAWTTP